jgi:hypothetical protein
VHQSTRGDAIKQQLAGGKSFERAGGEYVFGPDEQIGVDASRLGPFIPAKP